MPGKPDTISGESDTQAASYASSYAPWMTPYLVKTPPQNRARMEYDYPATGWGSGMLLRHCGVWALLWLCTAGVMGCNPFQDHYSGTYVEVREGLEEEILVIDLFRAGDYTNAIVRTYRVPQSSAPNELFDDELGCLWTVLGNAPDESGQFSLTIPKDPALSREELELDITLLGESMDVALRGGGTDPAEVLGTRLKTLALVPDRSPNKTCEERRPFFIQPDFDTKSTGIPPGSGHLISRPVFSILWLGVQARRVDSSVIVWVAKNVISSSVYLAKNLQDLSTNGLKGSMDLSVSTPEERALSESGETRYALGHFVVIDDACAQEDCSDPVPARLSWDVEREPIIAVSLERGVELGVEEPVEGAIGLGKALFYVEGRLSQLHPDTRKLIENAPAYVQQRDNAHFYVVDFYYDDSGNIIKMRLPPDPLSLTSLSTRQIPLVVTADYLKATEILLPRLLPIEDI